MSRRLAFVSCSLALLLLFTGCAAPKPTTIRVLTYNIHHGEGLDERVDLERIANLIRQTDADLVALQEVDRGVARTDGIDEPARLAKLTGMQVIFEKNIEYQGGDYGNAVLSRLPVYRHKNHKLPDLHPGEQRGLLEVRVLSGWHSMIFFATHFDYHPRDAERKASAKLLKKLIDSRLDTPIIVAGDLNDTPSSEVLNRMTDFLSDTFDPMVAPSNTYPADIPTKRIDYILHNNHPSLRSVEYRVIPETEASDHRPVLAVFEFQPGGFKDKSQ